MSLRRCRGSKRPDWTRRAWAVLAVTLVHNAEELLTVPAALREPPVERLLERWSLPAPRVERAFRTLDWAVSCAATAATAWGTSRRQPALPGVLAATMLGNVVLPHVPATVRARGYAPGVVTAVTLVLPVTGRFLALAHRQGLLTRRDLGRCASSGLALLVLGLPLGLVLADRLTRALTLEDDRCRRTTSSRSARTSTHRGRRTSRSSTCRRWTS